MMIDRVRKALALIESEPVSIGLHAAACELREALLLEGRACCGRCDRSPAQVPSCPHGEHCGRKPVAWVYRLDKLYLAETDPAPDGAFPVYLHPPE